MTAASIREDSLWGRNQNQNQGGRSIAAGVYTAASEPAGMCRIHLSALLVTAGQHQTQDPPTVRPNMPLWPDEKLLSHLDHSN